MSPEKITTEILRLAKENGGKPLGERLFLASTGLKRSHLWAAGFSSYSDALVAAGLSRNALNVASDPQVVLASLVALMRRIGKFPTKGHIKAARATDKSFPSYEAFLTASGGAFSNLPDVARTYCQSNKLDDLLPLIPTASPRNPKETARSVTAVAGYVYLVKHGAHFKIGRSNDVTRRRREISLLLPEELKHVHIIETDDPEGIEAYWHRRFASRRVRGEWFALTTEDIAAFKRRRYQ
ncbi:MAG: GIY-YIG nuclease family protein [Deltaproteobacteria bacterium]|nr:GIY-YIG nuclease family protein [Deltaproteobacteria bacterium]